MKICSTCNEKYPDVLNFCVDDGMELDVIAPIPIEFGTPPPPRRLDPFEDTMGSAPMPDLPTKYSATPNAGPPAMRSFGGLERLGPVIKKFFFGE